MATRIVHFGLDEHAIVSTLANQGYDVDECGYSISKLNDALHREESAALALEEDGVPLGEEIVTSVRSVSPLPLILSGWHQDIRFFDFRSCNPTGHSNQRLVKQSRAADRAESLNLHRDEDRK